METEIINGQKINIINNILSHMKKKGISKSELAKQIGWSVSKTSKIFSTEPDSQKINISDLIAIGIALTSMIASIKLHLIYLISLVFTWI